jgi:CubicO group peptidase (beta-lactamase class C family)
MSKSLDSEYLQFVDEASQRLFEKFKSNEKSAKDAGDFLAGEGEYVTRGKIDKARFEEAMSSDSYEGLREIFLQVPRENLFSLCSLNEVKIAATKSSRISGENHDEAIDNLKQIAGVEDKYDGVCVVKTKDDVREIGSENSDKPFSIYSIGKVLTGTLVGEMVARGIIPEAELAVTGLKLDEDVRNSLPEKVKQRVDEVTLHQTMTHHAGFYDYLPNYMDAIKVGVDRAEIPHPTNPRDFLIYANDKVKDHKGGTKKSYSNMGILLVGLVAEHYYNSKKPESDHKSYNEILQELVLEPAGMTGFSITPPTEALINPTSKVQPNMCGSPAGGYWATAHDMQNFAKHLCSRMQDESFRSAIENYGQEFYDKEKQVISHAGDIGAEGSAWFSVHIPSGTSCVMAQNSCFARMTGEQVSMVITSEQEREAAKSTDIQSFVERLGLQKPDEKPRSFVEAKQAGKYGNIRSKGGAHEL